MLPHIHTKTRTTTKKTLKIRKKQTNKLKLQILSHKYIINTQRLIHNMAKTQIQSNKAANTKSLNTQKTDSQRY